MCIIKFETKFLSPHGVGVVSSDADRKIESTNPAIAYIFYVIFNVQSNISVLIDSSLWRT